MELILERLDAQWPRLARSPEARRALIRWANDDAVFAGMHDLDEVLRCRRNPHTANQVHRVLARRAATEELAGRTLLQMLLPGLVRIVGMHGHNDPDAPDELVALAWERICTYPATREGWVAANVILDVRKRYVQLRQGDRIATVRRLRESPSQESLPEDQVLAVLQLEEIRDARRRGLVSAVAFDAIVRTRIDGEPLSVVAADHGFTTEVMCQRRWRAEQRLRSLPLAV